VLSAPPGHPGLETLLPLLMTAVADGRLTSSAWSSSCASGPRGCSTCTRSRASWPGSDADITIYDPRERRVIRRGEGESRAADCNLLFDGAEVAGPRARHHRQRRVAYLDGAVVGPPGLGRIVRPGASTDRAGGDGVIVPGSTSATRASRACARPCSAASSTPWCSPARGTGGRAAATFRYLTDFHLWGHDGLCCCRSRANPAWCSTARPWPPRSLAAAGSPSTTATSTWRRPWRTPHRGARPGAGRIGLVGERCVMGAGVRDELVEGLPAMRFERADELFDAIRAVKSPLELEQERELWPLVLAAMERFQQIVEPGVLGSEIAAEVTRPLWAAGARDILIFMGEARARSPCPQPEPLRCDDKTRFHLEVCGPSGHWCEVTINLAWRPPSAAEARLMAAEVEAFERIRAEARPGRGASPSSPPCSRPRCATTASDRGRDRPLRLPRPGHGHDRVPLARPGDALGPEPGLAARGRDGVLLPPAAPARRHQGWSTGLNEDIVITETGAERLSGGWDQSWRPMP
jgi:hypothetical protein